MPWLTSPILLNWEIITKMCYAILPLDLPKSPYQCSFKGILYANFTFKKVKDMNFYKSRSETFSVSFMWKYKKWEKHNLILIRSFGIQQKSIVKVGMIHSPDFASRQLKLTQKGFPNVSRKEGFNKLYSMEFTNHYVFYTSVIKLANIFRCNQHFH